MKIKLAVATALAATLCFSAEKVDERLNDAAEVLSENMRTPDKGIPQDLLNRSECLVIVPGLKKGAFFIGAKYGKGFITCRKAEHGWSAPGAIRVEGGSFGFQVGGQETDVILLVMNRAGVKKLLQSKFTLGADASAAAGPIGRNSSAETDAQMHAEILTYSRARGLFAGLSLGGATLRPDDDWNETLYGRKLSNEDIVLGNTAPPPASKRLMSTLMKYSSRRTK